MPTYFDLLPKLRVSKLDVLKAKSFFDVLKITNNFANIILSSTNEFCEHVS